MIHLLAYWSHTYTIQNVLILRCCSLYGSKNCVMEKKTSVCHRKKQASSLTPTHVSFLKRCIYAPNQSFQNSLHNTLIKSKWSSPNLGLFEVILSADFWPAMNPMFSMMAWHVSVEFLCLDSPMTNCTMAKWRCSKLEYATERFSVDFLLLIVKVVVVGHTGEELTSSKTPFFVVVCSFSINWFPDGVKLLLAFEKQIITIIFFHQSFDNE